MMSIKEGDTVTFSGNRKSIGLGLLVMLQKKDTGGGIFWSAISRKGTIIEGIMLGSPLDKDPKPSDLNVIRSNYFYPTWFRRALFYPGYFSPSLSFGLAYYKTYFQPLNEIGPERLGERGVAPMAGLGLELLTGRMTHVRIDFQYYWSPSIEYAGKKYRTDSLFLMGGLSLNW
ncbi:MAG: hypothetical protein HY747_00080 [Elusimicrobia bacterium]|nr:hypothetical protein [Elusimicrobiota bacterium]